MEKEVAADSSFIIFLAKLDIFSLAKNTFHKILLPEEVITELFEKDSSENELIKRELVNFIVKSPVNNIQDMPLGDGEKAAISLCLEKNIITLLSDDKKARLYAKSLGINVMGILGLLLLNLKEEKINKKEFLELLNQLITKGYYISPSLYAEVIRTVEDNFKSK